MLARRTRQTRSLFHPALVLVADPHSLVDGLPFLFLRLCGVYVRLALVPGDLGAQLCVALPACRIQISGLDGGPDSASILDRVAAIAVTATRRQLRDLREGGIQAFCSGPQLDLAHPRRVDQRTALRQG